MSFVERFIQAIIFELGAIIIAFITLLVMPHDGEGAPATVAVLLSVTAMVWNFIFNWIFDKIVTGDRLERGFLVRAIHAILFEGLLLLATVPMIMYMMDMTFIMALSADITMTLIIVGYTYVFNWAYDRVRLYFVKD